MPAPLPTAVVPAAAYTAGDVRIAIRGENFTPRAWQEVGAGGAVHVDAGFQAFLGSTALQDVRWEALDLLTATVPSGLSGGPFALRVVGPTGEGTLDGAFRALAAWPAALATTVSGPVAVEVGAQLTIDATVSNGGQAPVEALAVQLTAGPGLTPISVPSPPQAIEAGGSVHLLWTFAASAAGPAQVSLHASGLDAFIAQTLASDASASVLVLTAPALSFVPHPVPATVTIGQHVDLAVDVANAGEVDVAGLAFATFSYTGAGTFALDPAPAPQDLPAGATRTFRFGATATGSGSVSFSAAGGGIDRSTGAAVAAQAAWDPVLAQLPPQLTVRWLAMPGSVSPGDTFTASLGVTNGGEAAARAVLPSPDPPSVIASNGGALSGTAQQLPADIPGGGSAIFSWSYTETGPIGGTVQLRTGAQGSDANSGAPAVAAAVASLPAIVVQEMAAALSVAPAVLRGDTFQIKLVASNAGANAIVNLTPSSLSIGGAGAISCGAVSPSKADLPPSGSVMFSWTCAALVSGPLQISVSVSGTDSVTGMPRNATSFAASGVVEFLQIASDPFGDGTPIAFVGALDTQVYLAPRANGAGAVRFLPDGSGAQSISFSFAADTTIGGNINGASGPYPSLGFVGCSPNTLQCGPDNENGRGFFGSGRLNGVSWLLAGGAMRSSKLLHVYASNAAGAPAQFAFVDLRSLLTANSRATSLMATVNDKVYVAITPIKDPPILIELPALPALPGLNAQANVSAFDVHADGMPGISLVSSSTIRRIDALAGFGSSIYAFHTAGCARSSAADPASPGNSWLLCTPMDPAYLLKTSLTTSLLTDLTPKDRAFPQAVVYGARLYAARNTTAGPQLWSCNPGADGACDPLDWSLVAPNGTGDAQLTQFNDPGNSAVTLLVATPSHLLVGFDNPGGAVVMRSSAAAPASPSDFQPAAPPGLGVSATRIFDARDLSFGGNDSIYAAVGDGTAPVRLVRLVR